MRPDQGDGDYTYDQAHDLPHGEAPASGTPRAGQRPPSPQPSAVEPDGDYSYDQAHDAARH